MSRPRRDPRAEAARHALPGGARPRSTIEIVAAAPANGRPRRDPRAALAALVVAAPRRRLDRTLAAAGGGAATSIAGRGAAAPETVAAVAVAAPSVRIVDAPAYLVLIVPDAAQGRAGAHDRQLLGAARLLADGGGGAVVVLADGGEWGSLGADRVAPLSSDTATHATQPPPPAGEGREGGSGRRDAEFGAPPLPTLPRERGGFAKAERSDGASAATGFVDAAETLDAATFYDPERRASVVVDIVRVLSPRHVLFAETADGGDLARRVAAALGEPLFAGAESLTARAVTRPAKAGRVEQRCAPPRLVSLLADVVAPHAGLPHEGRAATLADLVAATPRAQSAGSGDGPSVGVADPPHEAARAERGGSGGTGTAPPPRGILAAETIPADPAVVPLAEANFVVSVGNGVTDFDAFHSLVAALSATPGASRVVCDAGLMPRDRQVGASGTVLDATCYFALGIAGAPQHLQGVAKCEHVVAVNTDLHAAMIERAGLAIVADAQTVMPALLRQLAEEGSAAREATADATAPSANVGQAAPIAAGRLPIAASSGPAPAVLAARVLLSAGCHRVSGRSAPVRTEAQATALALTIGAAVRGLHAGADAAAVADHFGHGLTAVDLVPLAGAADPVPALAAALAADLPDLVLCGRRGQGGDDGGLVPYALAAALGWTIVADVVALARDPSDPSLLVVEQALPRGARRRVTVALPAVVTVHPAAAPPRPFAFGPARRGTVETLAAGGSPTASAPAIPVEERAWRRRPRLISGAATGGTAADRLKAATEVAGGGGRVLVDPQPEEAAREIVGYLRGIGVLAPPHG